MMHYFSDKQIDELANILADGATDVLSGDEAIQGACHKISEWLSDNIPTTPYQALTEEMCRIMELASDRMRKIVDQREREAEKE